MQLDPDICYRAVDARDRRFDGRFFTGVKSTGVYCRPVCPARTPLRKNCTFFACAAAAHDAGFRPCRRCRPETGPGTPVWRGTSATVDRAVRLIDEGALAQSTVPDLAARVGVGERHLRRLFAEQLGASPLAIHHTRRVHFAKRLIEQTELPHSHVALAAGFANTRRFNAAIRRTFRRTPTQIRAGAHPGPAPDGCLTLRLPVREPFDWSALLRWWAPRLIPGVEHIDGSTYRRTAQVQDFVGAIAVSQVPGRPELLLQVPVTATSVLAVIADRVRTMFDLEADPTAIAEHLSVDPGLAALVSRHPGVRIPGCWDRFELAVRAILGQQVSVRGASTLAGRLVERFGTPAGDGALFPAAADLVDADIAALGMPRSRAETIRGLARAVHEGAPVLELAPDLDTAIDRLTALRGIGDWTAQYVAMRALREPDGFPAGDLGLRKALAGDGALPTAAELRRRAEAWRPWRGYAAMLLWQSLSDPPLETA